MSLPGITIFGGGSLGDYADGALGSGVAFLTPEDICPGVDETQFALLASLPRGRAWRTHFGMPEPGTVLWKFWRAVARPFAALEARLCALRQEFFCDSNVETHAAWLYEYGIPDVCDPYADLCTKVAAIGGQTVAYFQAVALRAGWAIDIARTAAAQITITIHTGSSPSYTQPAVTTTVARANRFRAGQQLSCPTHATTALPCLLARILPAHLQVIYVEA